MTPTSATRAVLSADESASLLASWIQERQPFVYARFGDGFLECISGRHGTTCDGEQYTSEIARAMRQSWDLLMERSSKDQVFLGDWMAASFENDTETTRYREQWEGLIPSSADPLWLHPEALLLMRESAELVEFYRAVKEDTRSKVYLGPAEHGPVAKMLSCRHIPTPMRNLFAELPRLEAALRGVSWDVLLFGAGMAGLIAAVRAWKEFPGRTVVHLGSALDPLFRCKSRRQQISTQKARTMFRELL